MGRSVILENQLSQTYVFDGSPVEQARLLALARRNAANVREMCSQAGLGVGARVLDVGCGPVGAPLDLAEIVGQRGEVVGVDSSAEAVAKAREIVASHGLANVRVVHADIHDMETEAIASDRSFDGAHLRAVLAHQSDPLRTLGRVATLLRPGGMIMMRDMVDDPRYPSFDPPLPLVKRAFELVSAAIRSRGGSVDVGRHLVELCSALGLNVVEARGTFSLNMPAEEPISGMYGMLAAARRTLIDTSLADNREIDELLSALNSARSQHFRTIMGPLIVHVIAHVPQYGREPRLP
jgi:SAM-dependent methyltransferase